MPEQIFIGNFAKGLKNDRLPFNIDNDAFPTMINFYSWRGRAKRKRGTVALARMQIQVQAASGPKNWQIAPFALSSAKANLLVETDVVPTATAITNITQASQAVVTIVGSTFSLGQIVNIINVSGMTEINNGYYTITAIGINTITLNVDSTSFTAYTSGGNAYLSQGPSIVPGTINLTVVDNGEVFTEPSTPDGTLTGSLGDTGTINYTTGAIVLNNGGSSNVTGTFSYYPAFPVMGLEDFTVNNASSLFPVLLGFDTQYSYQIKQTSTLVNFYNTTFFKNTNTPFVWSGQDYQQFWTANYANALWATNGKPGFNFVNGSASGSGTSIDFTFTSGGNPFQNLIINDVLWFNEWGTGGSTINGITGTVSAIIDAALGQYTVTFTSSQTASGTGIAQLLTNTIAGEDGIKWYDGDPTSGTGLPTGSNLGWVNFAPPLTAATVSIDDTPAALYYLVGATAVLPFKDRLLFFAPYIQSSSGAAIQLIDTVLWSWNGTPFYYGLTPGASSNLEISNASAFYVDQTGRGGYLPAGISQPIMTISNNEDALLIGFGGDGRKTRFTYTGNDLQPFLFYNINSELPSTATFSAIALDRGAIDMGTYGLAMTDQQSSQRIDLDIPDAIFQVQTNNNGMQRVNAIRDFQKEWIYFSYPFVTSQWKFPTQTFLFNYRDNTWAIFYENFTRHGNFRSQVKYTWKTIPFASWSAWRESWNSGTTSTFIPQIIAGNPQGYVVKKGEGTGEAPSGVISAIQNSGGRTQITSVNHCLTSSNSLTGYGDFIYIQGALGILSSTITAITLGTTTVITTVNTFSAGQYVTLSGIVGTTELNNNSYRVLSASGTSITLSVDSTLFTPYISGGTVQFSFNGQIGKVVGIVDVNNFIVDLPFPPGTYIGLGTFSRLSQPLLQTKQFPVYWQEGRQVRLCVQKYLMDFTANSQVTVNINLSQNPDEIWNSGTIVPNTTNLQNSALIYSQTMYTCPESTNIGLTPANTNLQMPTARDQFQIWHRFNTSLIGDSVQIGITLNETQMKNIIYATSEITLHGMHLIFEKGPHLA